MFVNLEGLDDGFMDLAGKDEAGAVVLLVDELYAEAVVPVVVEDVGALLHDRLELLAVDLDGVEDLPLAQLVERVLAEEAEVGLVNFLVLLQFLVVVQQHCVVRASGFVQLGEEVFQLGVGTELLLPETGRAWQLDLALVGLQVELASEDVLLLSLEEVGAEAGVGVIDYELEFFIGLDVLLQIIADLILYLLEYLGVLSLLDFVLLLVHVRLLQLPVQFRQELVFDLFLGSPLLGRVFEVDVLLLVVLHVGGLHFPVVLDHLQLVVVGVLARFLDFHLVVDDFIQVLVNVDDWHVD